MSSSMYDIGLEREPQCEGGGNCEALKSVRGVA